MSIQEKATLNKTELKTVMYLMKLPLQTGYIILNERCSSRLLRIALVVVAVDAVIVIHSPCGASAVHPPTRVDEARVLVAVAVVVVVVR